MAEFNIVFVLFDQVTQLDFAGPAQIFSRLPGATVHVAAKTMAPVVTDSHFSILPNADFGGVPQADLLCIPGGIGVAEALGDRTTREFVAEQGRGARYVTSVCTGAFLLGAAGLLRGRRATTHWAYTDLLPLVGATHEPGRVVRDGNLVTAGGVTAGIDFALSLAGDLVGQEAVRTIQLAMEYDPAPPFDSGTPEAAGEATVGRLRAMALDETGADLRAALTLLG